MLSDELHGECLYRAVWGRAKIVVLLISLIPLLNACSLTQDAILKGSDDPQVILGRLTINTNAPHFIDIQLEGHPYHGDWRSTPKRQLALSQIQDKSSRHYQAIASGLEPSPIVEVTSVLTSPDAPPLTCKWTRRYGNVEGACSLPDGRVWKLTLS